eukprot:GHVN01079974.1.p1 GENE.GHVN01079974.1~~GHVN01079974.1.p1  ORF type:complete len:985 (+),score=199.69 GHVN01079974.1:138-3092(+)
MMIRAYNYNTMEKVKEFEAHIDYIRYLAVHPTLSYLLSTSDDMTVKLWDWENNWNRLHTYEGHCNYVMMAQWNPKDVHLFATASLDRTIKVWGINSPGMASGGVAKTPHFNLQGHEKGVNCIEYSPVGERPYIISGSDDKTVKVWDYQTKQCIMTLIGHTKSINCALFHPHLPIIISGSEDGQCRVWHASTYRLETVMNFMLDRVWSVSCIKGSNNVAMGFDNGTLVVKLGSEAPICSLSNGKVVWSRGAELMTSNLKLLEGETLADGERITLAAKDMGACECFPQSISHHPSGRFIAVCGDGEYVVYTPQALRNMAYGPANDFAWSNEGHYATRVDREIKIFHNFKEHFMFKTPFQADCLFGGRLIGVRSSDFICFYDWHEYRMIRRIDVSPQHLWWNGNGTRVALACQDSFYVLRHDVDVVAAAIAGGAAEDEGGIEIAFELLQEINERVDTGTWVSESFLFVTSTLRLQIASAGQIDTLAFLDRSMYIVGYMNETDKVYLMDRDNSLYPYSVYIVFLDYQSAIGRKDFDTAKKLFKAIPVEIHNKVAKFLESQGHREDALEVTNDKDHAFELCLSLGYLQKAADIIRSYNADEVTGKLGDGASLSDETGGRWKLLGDAAIERGVFDLAYSCFKEAKDLGGLLLLHTATGDGKGVGELGEEAMKEKQYNIAFICYFSLGDVAACHEVLMASGRYPEASLFARTYLPTKTDESVKAWQEWTGKKATRQAAITLCSPSTHPDLFTAPVGLTESQLIDVSQVKKEVASEAGGATVPQFGDLLTGEEMATPTRLSVREEGERRRKTEKSSPLQGSDLLTGDLRELSNSIAGVQVCDGVEDGKQSMKSGVPLTSGSPLRSGSGMKSGLEDLINGDVSLDASTSGRGANGDCVNGEEIDFGWNELSVTEVSGVGEGNDGEVSDLDHEWSNIGVDGVGLKVSDSSPGWDDLVSVGQVNQANSEKVGDRVERGDEHGSDEDEGDISNLLM